MDNQHRKITGYRELTQDEIDLMNLVKETAATVGRLVELMRRPDHEHEIDQRWVAIGATDLQQGFMALNRAIARPESF